MPRIEIELTSSRPDGTWTWRAAGARQPKGTLDGSLLRTGAKVGDVLRAETEQGIDGIHVTSVLPPKAKRAEPERLALLGPPEREAPSRPSGDGTSAAPPRDDRRGGPRRGGRDYGARPSGREREPRPGGRERGPRPTGRDRDTREAGDRGPRRRPPQTREGGRRPERSRDPGDRESAPPRPRAKRLHPGRANREAVLAELAPEQRPVAEQVLRGGIPAVRQAVDEHNAKARAAGQPEIKADPFLAMAEDLLPRLRAAEWRDRAEAAMADVDTISLRDLRAIVTGSDAAGRDDVSRTLVSDLREAVERRSAAEREKWLDEVRGSLTEGRVVRALRVSGRPPEPGQRFPVDLGEQLSAAASAAMTPQVAPERWAAVLDAVVSSPVRLSVRPEGLPREPGEALISAVRRAAGRVPALRALVGGPPPDRRPPPPSRPPRPSPPAGAERPASGAPPPPPTPGDVGSPPPAPLAEPAAPSASEPSAPEPVPEAPTADSSPDRPGSSGDDGDDPVLVQELGQPLDQS